MASARKWVREYLLLHPNASVDNVTKQAYAHGFYLYRGEISEIRHAVTATRAAEKSVIPDARLRIAEEKAAALEATGYSGQASLVANLRPMVVEEKQRIEHKQRVPSAPFNPPRVVEARPAGSAPAPYQVSLSDRQVAEIGRAPRLADVDAKVPRKAELKSTPTSTAEERLDYLEEYVLNNPMSTGPEVEAALRHRFGMGVDAHAVSAALIAIRDITNEAPSGAKLRPGSARFERRRAELGLNKPPPKEPQMVPNTAPPQPPKTQPTFEEVLLMLKRAMIDKAFESITFNVDAQGKGTWTAQRRKTEGGEF